MVETRTDAELIAEVRDGRTEAYAVLYRRHEGPARALARQLARCPGERDDLVAEAFARLLATLRAGGGPDVAFRAYLLTVLRHVLHDRARRDGRIHFTDDLTRYDSGEPWRDPAVDGLEARLAARAFAGLPERWRAVLWRTEVERRTPAEVAPLLGLTPNGVSALAYRAREGLRQAYLQEHVPAPRRADAHAVTVGRLGAWARGGLTDRRRTQVEEHLAECPRCRALAAELTDTNAALTSSIDYR
jgi:RNA polymerase sigma factor (sigma-70 family)